MSATRIFLLVSIALTLLAAVGCQSSSTASTPAMEPIGRAIVVSGNTGSYTVFIPSADKTHADVYASSADAKICPDCKAAAEHYFLTGELVAKCPITGATRTALSYTPPTVGGHN